ncbi:hypothetical protein JCM11491_006406 [Sporobolomyces phaffii]
MSTIAPPSHPGQVISALSLALSPSPTARAESLGALQAWSILPGYYSYLVNIFADAAQREVDDQVRLQALLQFKNGVDKYWRRTANNAISREEKAAIRPQLLTMVDEPNTVIAKNLAVTMGKLARLDYGVDWNDLPETLLSSLHSSTSLLTLHRTLLYLHSMIKSLASNRIPKGRLLMKKLTQLLFEPLVAVHASVLSRAVERLQRQGLTESQGGDEVEEVECALLAFKSLRFLTIYGDSNPAQNDTIKTFFVSTAPTFTSLVQLRLSLLSSASASSASTSANAPVPETRRLTLLTKHVISYTKLYRGLIDQFDLNVFDQMGITTDVLQLVWEMVKNACAGAIEANINDSFASPYPTRLVIGSLVLLKSTTSSWDGQTPLAIPWSFIEQFSTVLVTKLLLLRPDELERWEDDPEEFVHEEELGESQWEFELRPCAEWCLRGLIGGYKDELGPVLARYVRDASAETAAAGIDGLLLKEAVYTAVGKSAQDLTQSLDFDEWLKGTLVREVAGQDPQHRIIRRRIAWLLGCLISQDLVTSSRPLVYSLIVHLLSRNASTDPAIRLTAAQSLAKCDTWDFDLDGFLPQLGPAIEQVVQLLGEVQLGDTLMRLNQTLAVIIGRVGQHIAPYAPRLAEILTRLWAQAEHGQLPHFQTSILVTLTRLVEALGDQASSNLALVHASTPIIRASIDSTNPSHVYLQEDGLELWQVLLRRVSTLSPEMLGLLPALVGLIAQGTDVLPRCLSIFESYLLLDSQTVIEACSGSYFSAISPLLGDASGEGLRLEGVKVVLHSLNTVFKTCPADSGSVASWAGPLDESGCFQRVLQVVSKPDASALIVTKYLSTLARIVLSSATSFHLLVAATSRQTHTPPDGILAVVVDQFVDRVDNVSQGGQRKLVALALAELLTSSASSSDSESRVVLTRLGALVSLWSGVLAQTEETQEGDAELYHLADDYASEIDYDYTETLETQRRSALALRDPVTTHKLSTFISTKLALAQQLYGGQQAFNEQWLNQIDPIIVEELVQRLDGKLKG